MAAIAETATGPLRTWTTLKIQSLLFEKVAILCDKDKAGPIVEAGKDEDDLP